MGNDKKILQLGYGGFGKHHLTSIKKKYSAYVYDPFVKVNDPFIHVIENLEDIRGDFFDIIIVAINASKHIETVDLLKRLEINAHRIIIEKVPDNSISSSLSDFQENMYVNFPRRHYPFYQSLQVYCSQNKLQRVIIEGGNNSMLCNALHYIDIVEFLSKKSFTSIESQVDKVFEAKRAGFYEAVGTIFCQANSLELVITNTEKNAPNTITMKFEDGSMFSYVEREGITVNTSKFSWDDEIVKNQSILSIEYLDDEHKLPSFNSVENTNNLFVRSLIKYIPTKNNRVLIT